MLNDKQRKLVEDNLALAYSLLKSWNTNSNNYDDYLQECFMGLIDAALNYNSEIANFSTYAYKCMNNRLIKKYNSDKSYYYHNGESLLSLEYNYGSDEDEFTLEDTIPYEVDFFQIIMDKDIEDKFNTFIDKRLDKNEKIIIKKYLEGYDCTKIADMINSSASYTNYKLHKIIRKWRWCVTHNFQLSRF